MKRIDIIGQNGNTGLHYKKDSDLSISRNARVSYDAEWRAGEVDWTELNEVDDNTEAVQAKVCIAGEI